MAVPDGSGGAGRHPGNSPGRGRGRRRRQSRESETEKVGDGVAAGGAVIRRALQGSRGHRLLSEYLMTLVKETAILALGYKSHTLSKSFLALLNISRVFRVDNCQSQGAIGYHSAIIYCVAQRILCTLQFTLFTPKMNI